MWKGIKKGFGFAVGFELGKTIVWTVAKFITDTAAKDDEYMEGLKERKPELYERLKKTQSNKEESVEESEEEEAQ